MRQRWYGGKARQIERVQILDWGVPAAGAAPVILMILGVTDATGTARYFVPVVLSDRRRAQDSAIASHSIVAYLDGGAVLADAVMDDDVCVALAEMLSRGGSVKLAEGHAAPRFPGGRVPAAGPLRPVVRGKSEQSNTTVFLARRVALKLIRKLDDGPNPDVEIGLYLAEVGFSHVPRLEGAFEYHQLLGPPTTVAMLQSFVPNQGNGWEQAQAEVRQYLDEAASRLARGDAAPAPSSDPLGGDDPPADVTELMSYLADVETLGRRTAELHMALARGTDEAFAAETTPPEYIQHLAASMREHGGRALDLLASHRDRLPSYARPLADQILQGRRTILREFDRIVDAGVQAQRIRVHGDYHLGQVLRTDHDFVIVDFEGEPMRSLAERREKQLALKDVAGLLRSFDYAIFGGLQDRAADDRAAFDRLESWARTWQSWTSARFVRAYRDTAGDARFVPQSPEGFAAALDAFLLDRALYELIYELNNRPTWVSVPLHGLRRFMR
jgi:trehalose synthase-fused probable maltokinase